MLAGFGALGSSVAWAENLKMLLIGCLEAVTKGSVREVVCLVDCLVSLKSLTNGNASRLSSFSSDVSLRCDGPILNLIYKQDPSLPENMLDPLTGLSVAGNIVQFVDFWKRL